MWSVLILYTSKRNLDGGEAVHIVGSRYRMVGRAKREYISGREWI